MASRSKGSPKGSTSTPPLGEKVGGSSTPQVPQKPCFVIPGELSVWVCGGVRSRSPAGVLYRACTSVLIWGGGMHVKNSRPDLCAECVLNQDYPPGGH